uniref:C1q domain-containing protein n=1 Tax=Denticeps clupeoides TaxID=299321 RepID=A0AAY4AR50_9TELE
MPTVTVSLVALLLHMGWARDLEVRNLEGRLRAAEDGLQRLKYVLEELRREYEGEGPSRMVAFSASLHSGKIGPLPTATTLIYDDVLTNYGQAYDSDKGTFTAPVGGVYYLTFKANAPAGSALAVSLVKNDGVQCSVYGELGGDAGSGAVLALRKGDRVVTRLSSNSCVEGDEKRRTGFGGFLLFPTA